MPQIEITGVTNEFRGVGRLEGKAVFVPDALPGETVEITVKQEKASYIIAENLGVLKASPFRTEPACPHYAACGGCACLHARYEHTLELKRQNVLAALNRIGALGLDEIEPCLPSPLKEGWRNKAEFAVEGGRAGFRAEGERRVTDVDYCRQLSENMNRAWAFVKPLAVKANASGVVLRENHKGEIMLVLCVNIPSSAAQKQCETAYEKLESVVSCHICRLNPRPVHALDGQVTHVCGEKFLTDRINGLSFRLAPQAFFQVNRLQAENVYRLALDGVSPGEKVCDIYCGAGTISLSAAKLGALVTGIEIVPEAVANARGNADLNGLAAEFICGNAAQMYPPLLKKRRFDRVIVDPPRKGLDEKVLDALVSHPAPRLSYVSCDPATLARDLKKLCDVYSIESVTTADMFPGTGHMETACLLRRPIKDLVSVPFEPKNADCLKLINNTNRDLRRKTKWHCNKRTAC
ncbi:MAG: 23S rRNA (uracil(1939)-C(5))-methyltransferase RlmD [Clostridiales bacterium]|nr:23S rRNA (uracil(1939)-C(5))-methyltransferase RlmD [Clostridiales bacterium]